MAINLVTKSSGKLLQDFVKNSYFAGKASNEYDLVGARSLRITSAVTVPLSDYTREGLARFGELKEVQDTVQELTMSQDKAFSLSIDKTNQSDQLSMKKAGEVMKAQMDEQVYPYMDKYALKRYAEQAGQIMTLSAKPTAANILKEVNKMRAARVNAKVPAENNYLGLPAALYSEVLDSDKFVHIERVAGAALEKGVVGSLYGFSVMEIPDEYFPEGVYALAFQKKSVIAPKKIHSMRIIEEDKDVDGSILQGHFYFDNFVLGKRAGGVIALTADGMRSTAPTVSVSGTTATVSGDGVVYYTTDGSDPRYSAHRQVYSGTVSLQSGQVIHAYAVQSGLLPSAVASGIAE